MDRVIGIRVSLNQVINSDAPSASAKDWVIPKKATILSNNYGTLIQADSGDYFLVPVGLWFRSVFSNKNLPQVEDFNKLQDLGLTLIKDKIVRNEDKPISTEVEELDGQKVRSQNIISSSKINKTVAANIKRKEENKDRP